MFTLSNRSSKRESEGWSRRWTPAGVVIRQGAPQSGEHPVGDPLLAGYLTQLKDDDLSVEAEQGHLIGWDSLYSALERPEYAALAKLLDIPTLSEARPALMSRNSLTDRDFSISFSGWRRSDGSSFDGQVEGALLIDGESQALRHTVSSPASAVSFPLSLIHI